MMTTKADSPSNSPALQATKLFFMYRLSQNQHLLPAVLFITALILCTAPASMAQSNPHFFLHENGVTILCPDAETGDSGEVGGIVYTKRSRAEITAANAATTCTSGITDMSQLFMYPPPFFDEDLSSWDVSQVTNMSEMFFQAPFFDADIRFWDVSQVTNMYRMFSNAYSFRQDINGWDVSQVTNMTSMFAFANRFNHSLNSWDVSNVTNMSFMFRDTQRFDGDISSWDVSNVTDMRLMFFRTQAFNQDIGNWDVSAVTNMREMFANAHVFNRDLNNWDVSAVTNMTEMFYYADAFDGDISDWDVSNVTNMRGMFHRATAFSGDLSNWDVSSVQNMNQMFAFTDNFISDISGWDVSQVTDMVQLFRAATAFNQDLSGWCVLQISTMPNMFDHLATSWELPRPVWGTCPPTGVNVSEEPLPYTFSLSQNYPNPFNPTTNIEYELPQAAEVTLSVYSLTGQQVATLANGYQNAGSHSVTFDGAGLSSGVYIYRITAGEWVLSRKMLLLK